MVIISEKLGKGEEKLDKKLYDFHHFFLYSLQYNVV